MMNKRLGSFRERKKINSFLTRTKKINDLKLFVQTYFLGLKKAW